MNKNTFLLSFFLIELLLLSAFSAGGGNTRIESFSKAKKIMKNQIFVTSQERKTLYCGASFDRRKNITLPEGFSTSKYKKRQARWEAEHMLPASAYGGMLTEWRKGHPDCIDRKGRAFKGRNCASKTNRQYRLMQADLYGLWPAIGSVNALRLNYNFSMLPGEASDFGACDFRVENRKVQPPVRARGIVARTYLYFDTVYPFSMSDSQRKLMRAWDRQYPVSPFECKRNKIIKRVQGNANPVLDARC